MARRDVPSLCRDDTYVLLDICGRRRIKFFVTCFGLRFAGEERETGTATMGG